MELAPVDIADLADDIVARARPLADRNWEARSSGVAVADLDRERIVQAWMNLVRNAVQHTESGDRITVFSTVDEEVVELGVSDAGEGVSPEDRQRFFERFGRGSSARRTRSDGAGLGLAIAAAIAEAHGGEVTLWDTPGGGATFALVLPLEPEPESIGEQEDDEWHAS